MRLTIHVQPRASRTEVVGLHGDALKLRLAAPPVDGAANDALLQFVADTLGRPRRDVTLEGGAAGRRKLLRVEGLALPEVTARLLP
ncbi:MAG: DUF167 domain-containing protein [Gemmatimonadales bacterium]|nr:DUF167 domain-containing protein [Gemmatimonadales bacterium]